MSPPTFTFTTDTYTSGFTVVKFRGKEKMSHLFAYKIVVKVATGTVIDDEAMIGDNATFTFVSNIDTIQNVEVSGIISAFEYLSTGAKYNNYRVTLAPKAWTESLGVDYEIFLNMTPREIIDTEIADANIEAVTTAVLTEHKARSFTCQYNESRFAFISRIAEHYGMYYYFDYSDNSKMIFSDEKPYPAGDSNTLIFDDLVAGDNFFNRIKRFKKNTHVGVAQVIVSGSEPDQPSAVFSKKAGDTSAPDGNTLRLVNEDVADSDEAQDIADIRFDEIQTNATVFNGKSGAIQLRPGFSFDLSGHLRDGSGGGENFNDTYLVTAIIHEGQNLDQDYSDGSSGFYYRNSFSAIKSNVQFRPGKITPKPHATSTSGTVYSEVRNSRLAERNDKGEYRVRFDFLDDSILPKPSSWLRMATPASGTEDTIDIPLKGGVEVHISFANGNPDKPFIQSALPNTQFPSHVTSNNMNNALIATSGLLGLKANGGWYRNIHVNELDMANREFGQDPFSFTTIPDVDLNYENIMPEDDEYSGNYNIDRSYGHNYVYVDGNTYCWDNQKTYNFGNDYTEVHEIPELLGKDPEDKKQYPMEEYMRSIKNEAKSKLHGRDFKRHAYNEEGELEEVIGYETWTDGEDGLTQKVWGDKMDFHEGRVFCWSGGRGPGGSLETFNYGNGYTENLKECGEGTSASNGLTTQAGADWTDFPAIMGDASSATIDKTWGNTYTYHEGATVDIRKSSFEGNDTIFDIDAYAFISETHGNTEDTVYGKSKTTQHGAVDAKFLGGTSEMTLGATSDVYVGGRDNVMVGGTLNVQLAAESNLSAVYTKDIKTKKLDAASQKEEATLKSMISSLNITNNAPRITMNAASHTLNCSAFATTKTNVFSVQAGAVASISAGGVLKLG